jgi:hypothetical protein
VFFSFALEYAIKKIKENHEGRNGRGCKSIGDNINNIKKIVGALTDASKEAVLEVHIQKTKYMLISRYENAGQHHNIKVANRSFQNLCKTRVTTLGHSDGHSFLYTAIS